VWGTKPSPLQKSEKKLSAPVLRKGKSRRFWESSLQGGGAKKGPVKTEEGDEVYIPIRRREKLEVCSAASVTIVWGLKRKEAKKKVIDSTARNRKKQVSSRISSEDMKIVDKGKPADIGQRIRKKNEGAVAVVFLRGGNRVVNEGRRKTRSNFLGTNRKRGKNSTEPPPPHPVLAKPSFKKKGAKKSTNCNMLYSKREITPPGKGVHN